MNEYDLIEKAWENYLKYLSPDTLKAVSERLKDEAKCKEEYREEENVKTE